MRKITLGCSSLNSAAKTYLNQIIDSNRLSYGPFSRRLEHGIATMHGCTDGVLCNSGTSALTIALDALKEVYSYKSGDEVLVPAITFIATSNIVLHAGLKPVFVDVHPREYTMNFAEIQRHITERTRCIIPVHLFGLPADMPLIKFVANQYNLQIIEDSCEMMFGGIHGQPVGSFGDLACFSTYVAHLITGGVGGLVTTSDKRLAAICRSLLAHGRDAIYTDIDADDTEEEALLKEMIERRFSFERLGYSFRATEMEAAVALSQLEHSNEIIRSRRENATYLSSCLNDLKDTLQLPMVPNGFDHSFMMYPIVLKNGSREELLAFLEKHGIETRYMFPLLTQPIYQKLFPGLHEEYPVAKELSHKGFFIGIHQGLTKEDLDYVSDAFHVYFNE